jgi:hypothetical protein
MTPDEILRLPPYCLTQGEKNAAILPHFADLTEHHRLACPQYARVLAALFANARKPSSPEEIPYLPVRLFKSHQLRSIPESAVFKTLTSSGTSGDPVSQVYLDRETAQRQTLALSRILTSVLGPDRLPMLVVDSPGILRDRQRFSARAAGVLGMMNFGREHCFVLTEDMCLDESALNAFLERHRGRTFLVFGFTSFVWQHFYRQLAGRGLDLSNGILVHSGGWKRLLSLSVDNAEFKRRILGETGLNRIYNFYGMAEQVGSVFLEGDDGFLYTPNFADIVVRDPITLAPLGPGQIGVLQVLSILPTSYPGHSILTEDLGVVHSIDANGCGRQGKSFSVLGRLPSAELRGCSDVGSRWTGQ